MAQQQRESYVTDVRCSACGCLLAESGSDGKLLVHGVPVTAIAGNCPECGEPWAWPRMGIEVGLLAIEEVARALTIIGNNGGFGTLLVRFQKGRARWVGLGESLRDVSQ